MMYRGRVISPLTGRDKQLHLLSGCYRKAVDGSGGAVLITGEAGTGKTRMVSELLNAHSDTASVLSGGCVAIGGKPLRHAAFLEILRSVQPEMSLATLTTSDLMDRILSLLNRHSKEQPVLVLIEDLHWADAATCEMLSVLIRHTANKRILIIVTARDDELPPGHAVRELMGELVRSPLTVHLPIPRLTAAQTAQLMESLEGPAVDGRRVSTIYSRTEGNPFLIEELSSACPAGTRITVQGPLRDVLLSRFHQLSKAARQVVRAVAVAGTAVNPLQLPSVLQVSEESLQESLLEAVDNNVLAVNGDNVILRHVLAAQAILEVMVPSERHMLHQRWAQELDGAHATGQSPTSLSLIAHHWVEANQPEAALVASVRAGKAHRRVLANDEVLRHLDQALKLWDRVPTADGLTGSTFAEVSTWASEAASWTGATTTAVGVLDTALRRPDVVADPAQASVLWERRGSHLLAAGRLHEAGDSFEEALRLLPPNAPAAASARALVGRARMQLRNGDLISAMSSARQAQGTAKNGQAVLEEALALLITGNVLLTQGEIDAAIDELTRAADVGSGALGPATLGTILMSRATALSCQSRILEAAQDALARARRFEAEGKRDPEGLVFTAVAGYLLYRLGKMDESRRLGEYVLKEATAPVTLMVTRLLLGMLALDRGDLEESREQLEMGRFLSVPLRHGRLHGAFAMGRTELALARGDVEAARAAVQEGVARVRNTGDDEILGLLLLLGLRVEGDSALLLPGRSSARAFRRSSEQVEEYRFEIDGLLEPSLRVLDRRPDLEALKLTADAEMSRFFGRSEPDTWQEAAAKWFYVQRPRLGVYCDLRAAEARLADPNERVRAKKMLQELAFEASEIGSELIARHIAVVAERSRITLDVAPSARSNGGLLTAREEEVLDLVAGGATNRQIASKLFISEKTASVHVSHILTKLGVATRAEAVALHKSTKA